MVSRRVRLFQRKTLCSILRSTKFEPWGFQDDEGVSTCIRFAWKCCNMSKEGSISQMPLSAIWDSRIKRATMLRILLYGTEVFSGLDGRDTRNRTRGCMKGKTLTRFIWCSRSLELLPFALPTKNRITMKRRLGGFSWS